MLSSTNSAKSWLAYKDCAAVPAPVYVSSLCPISFTTLLCVHLPFSISSTSSFFCLLCSLTFICPLITHPSLQMLVGVVCRLARAEPCYNTSPYFICFTESRPQQWAVTGLSIMLSLVIDLRCASEDWGLTKQTNKQHARKERVKRRAHLQTDRRLTSAQKLGGDMK